MNSKKRGIGIFAIVIVFLLISSVFLYSNIGPTGQKKKLNEIFSYFDNNQVASYELDLNNGDLTLKLKADANQESSNEQSQGVKPNRDNVVKYTVGDISGFIKYVEPKVTEYNKANPDSPIVFDNVPIRSNFLMNFLPVLLVIVMMVVFYFMIMKQANGGSKAMSFGKAKIKPQTSSKKVTFKDVAGADEEKEELEEIVDFLKNPRSFNEMGARIPKGVLLVGPPGTGKTLLAKAVSGEAGVPFFSISGSDFVEMFVGVGASRVRDLFEQAKKAAPSIVFIDEIDAVGRHRGAGLGGGHDEREQTLNQLLVEMDGFGANEGVIVMAATNRHDILDPALLRPGRFDRQVFVGYPDIKGREEILKIHTRGKPLAPDVELKTIAKTTVGFTGADLENVSNEAALLATRNKHKAITMTDFNEATIKVIAGPEKKSRVVTEKDKINTAYHEAGHAVVTYFLSTQDPVHEVSIIPRGMAGGYTLALPQHDKSYKTKREMTEEMVVLLGGRVAEKIVLDDISTGASNDIQRATAVARAMITKYGFSDKLGPILYGSQDDEVFLGKGFAQSRNYSENVASEIDAEIRELIDSAYEKAKDILTEHNDKLELVAQSLLIKEKIDGEFFKAVMEGKEIPTSIIPEEKTDIQQLDETAPKQDTIADSSENNDNINH